MEFSDMLIIVNLAGLMILGFVGWTQIKAAKMQILDIVNRDLAEVRRQMALTGRRRMAFSEPEVLQGKLRAS